MAMRRFVSVGLSLILGLGPIFSVPPLAMAAETAATAGPSQDAPPVVVGELTEERTATTKVYELSDGTRRASVAQQPVHYQDESGQWDDIVTALVPAEAPGAHEVAANDLDIELGTDALGVPTARIQGDGFAVGVDLAGETENVKVCLGSEATYLNVAPHASLSVEARPDGFKQEVVLDSQDAPNSYTFDVALDGLELRQGIGGLPVLYRPGRSEPVGDLGRLFVFDSAGEGTVGTTCPDPVTTIQQTPGGAKITYTVPRTWLDDPARVYPVVIDPTATIYNVVNPLRDCPDTFVCVGSPGTAYGSQAYLSVGYGANKETYSFARFDQSSVPASAYVDAASLKVYQYTGATNLVRFGRVTSSWNESTTWNTKPSFSYLGAQTPASSAAWLTQGCTGVVRDWRTGASADYGLAIYENYGETGNHREFRSGDYGDTAYRPRLVIDYHTPSVTVTGHASTYQVGDTVATTMTVVTSMTASVEEMRMLLNYKSGVPSRYRGYLAWFKTDPGSGWTKHQLTDGSYLAYFGGATFGTDKVEPDLANSFVTDGTGTKSVCFKFRIGEDFGDIQDNDFDTYFAIDAGAGNFTSGWRSQDTNVDVAPSGITTASVETTASGWHTETDTNSDGTPEPNDTVDEGRGSAALSWAAVSGASSYKVKLFDGVSYRDVATTTATSWTSAGKGLYRTDSALASVTPGSNPFVSGGAGRDLRDDPRAMYRATTGTDAPVAPNYNFKVVPVLPSGVAAPDSSCATLSVALENRTKRLIDSPDHTSHELPEIAGDGARLILDTREIELSATDLSINSFGPAAALSRVYRSKATGTPALGAGWRMSFEQSLEVTGTKAIWTDEAGEAYTFVRSGTRWVAPNGLAATLSTGTAGLEIAFDGRRVVGFDASGRLDFERDGSGNTVDYDISQDVTITAANGQSIVIDRDTSGAVLSAAYGTAAGTREVIYSKVADALTVTRYPATSLECSTTYTYADGRITGIERPAASESWEVGYDASGDVTNVENVSGAPTPAMRRDVSYGTSTATVSTFDGQTFYRMNPTGTTSQASTEGSATLLTTISYGALGLAIREVSPTGRTTSRVYDAAGRVVSETDAEGRTATSEYNAAGDLVRSVSAAGSVSMFEPDAFGNIVRETKTLDVSRTAETTRAFAYDGAVKGRMTREAKRISATQWAVATFADFDAVTGQPGSATDEDVLLAIGGVPVDLTRTTDYDEFGNAVAETAPSGAITASRTYDLAGRELASEDASGVVTNSRYDACGRVVESYRSHEATAAKLDWKTTTYDGAGNALTETTLDSGGAVVSSVARTYDALGREIKTDDSLVPGSATLTYDSRGNTVIERAEGASSETSATTRTDYNAEGEAVEITEPGATDVSTTASYTAGGEVDVVEEADGAATEYDYDETGEVSAEYEDVEGSAVATTTYERDADGNTVGQTAPDGAVTTYTFDLLGRQTGAKAGDQQLSATVYNTAGQVLSFTDFDSITTTTTYDVDGNVLVTSRGGLVTASAFDSCGRKVSAVNPDGSSALSFYDVFGRAVRTVSVGTNGVTARDVSTGYDAAGRIAWNADAISGLSRTLTHGPDGHVSTVERLGVRVSTVTVDGAGQLLGHEVSVGGTVIDRAVVSTDAAGRTTRWCSTALSADDDVVFDEAGRIVTAESLGASYTYSNETGKKSSESYVFGIGLTETAGYTYTIDSRLESARIGSTTTTYAYEAVSGAVSGYRRSGEASVALSYDSSGRVTSVGTRSVVHDGLGRRTQEGLSAGTTRTYTWSGERLVGISQPGLSASYVYDAAGQRTRSVVTSGSLTTTTNWTYEGLALLRLAASRSDGATWSIDYAYDEAGRPFAGVYAASDATTTVFQLATSDRGDVRELKDASGASFALYGSDAYGGVTTATSAPSAEVPAALAAAIAERQPLRYAGYVRDAESALYYCSQRYYDPSSFAFISKDPVRADGEESAYQYCCGEPAGGVDPEGLHSSRYGKHYHAWNNDADMWWSTARYYYYRSGSWMHQTGYRYVGMHGWAIDAIAKMVQRRLGITKPVGVSNFLAKDGEWNVFKLYWHANGCYRV